MYIYACQPVPRQIASPRRCSKHNHDKQNLFRHGDTNKTNYFPVTYVTDDLSLSKAYNPVTVGIFSIYLYLLSMKYFESSNHISS